MMLGAVYTELRQDEQAIACYTTVLREFERASPKARQQFGEQGKLLSTSIAACSQVAWDATMRPLPIASVPPNLSLIMLKFSRRGISYAYLGERDRALSDGKQAIALAPQEASHYNRLGEIYLLRQDILLALDTFRQGRELDPTDEQLQVNWSRALLCWMMVLFQGQDEHEAPATTNQEP